MELVNGLYNVDKKQFADPYGNGIQRFDQLANYMQIAIDGLGDNTSSAIEVAKALCLIRDNKMYWGYPVQGSSFERYYDFIAFCKAYFRCGKSTIYNYIALYEQFGAYGKKYADNSFPSSFDVSKYTYSQLLLMLPLSGPELNLVNPAMTCKEIKAYVKTCKEAKSANSKRLENVANDEELVVPVEEFETFKLNNDERRKEFLTTYPRWNECAKVDVLNCKLTFFEINLTATAKCIAVQVACPSRLREYVRYYLVDSALDYYDYRYQIFPFFAISDSASERMLVDFMRDQQIKSIDIAKA